MGQLANASKYGIAFANTGSTPTKFAAGHTTPGRIFNFLAGVVQKGLGDQE
jgi:hypothetical protein